MRSVDDADFTAFVAGASRRLLRSAYLITGDLSSAEDLLQTSLERAYRRWSYCRRWGTPEAYVRRIIVNAATDRWRREQALRKVSLNEAQVPPLDDARLEVLPVREALIAGLRELPAGQRACSRRRRHQFRCAFGLWRVLIFLAIFRATPERAKCFFRCGSIGACRPDCELSRPD